MNAHGGGLREGIGSISSGSVCSRRHEAKHKVHPTTRCSGGKEGVSTLRNKTFAEGFALWLFFVLLIVFEHQGSYLDKVSVSSSISLSGFSWQVNLLGPRARRRMESSIFSMIFLTVALLRCFKVVPITMKFWASLEIALDNGVFLGPNADRYLRLVPIKYLVCKYNLTSFVDHTIDHINKAVDALIKC